MLRDDGLSWLATLNKPDFPVRFEPSVVRYLRFYKNEQRGRQMVATWVRKSGRYKSLEDTALAYAFFLMLEGLSA